MALTAADLAQAGAQAFLPQVTELLAAASRELRAHRAAAGSCAACGQAFPCDRAQLADFTLGSLAPASPQQPAVRHAWAFPGTPDQVRRVRHLLAAQLAGCPRADDVLLAASELAANAIQHSASGRPGGTFTVRAAIHGGYGVLIEVEDHGGHWQQIMPDERMHGLAMITALGGCLTVSDTAGGRIVATVLPWSLDPGDTR